MSATTSAATGRRYGIQRVCQAWDRARRGGYTAMAKKKAKKKAAKKKTAKKKAKRKVAKKKGAKKR